MNKLLTIVVPVYNVEPYIKRCLDSCLIYKTNEQGEKVLDDDLMNQLEVIIVNDGTPDNSAEMSREYVKRFSNTFRQIDKENGGHGSAWNVGLKEATGKYLRFLDSDDWLTNLDLLMKKLETMDVDLVFTQLVKYIVSSGEHVRYPVNGPKNVIIQIKDFPYKQTNDYTVCDFQYCTYKTALLQPLDPLFDEHVFYDDMILFVVPQMLAKTCLICDFVLYNYLMGRLGQTMDVEVQKRNSAFLEEEYQKMLQFYNDYSDNNDAKGWVEHAILTHVAQHDIIGLPKLPYLESKQKAMKLKNELGMMQECIASKQLNRLLKYPYWLSYFIEKVRLVKNK